MTVVIHKLSKRLKGLGQIPIWYQSQNHVAIIDCHVFMLLQSMVIF